MRALLPTSPLLLTVWLFTTAATSAADPAPLSATARQITFGPRHHFFGYFGHVRTIPWDASGRYIVALESEYQDRMPQLDEPADIVLIDTQNNYALRVVEQTRAWNFQQGTISRNLGLSSCVDTNGLPTAPPPRPQISPSRDTADTVATTKTAAIGCMLNDCHSPGPLRSFDPLLLPHPGLP